MLCVWPRGVWPRDSVSFVMRPSVDCPWGPGLGGTAPRFQNGIRSNAAGGREGAGRGGGPASWAVLRWALASSCLCAASTAAAAAVSGCRRDGMPVAAACWAWERCFWYCGLPVPDQTPLASPFPGPSELLWQLRCGTGPWGWGTRLLGCSVSGPHPTSLAPRSLAQVLGLATPPTLGWHNQGFRVRLSIF